MADYLNAVCSVCGKPYHVCGDCKNTRSFTPWRAIADSMECYKIFLALNDYTNGRATREQTREFLCRRDLSELETYEEHVKNMIKTLLMEKDRQEECK